MREPGNFVLRRTTSWKLAVGAVAMLLAPARMVGQVPDEFKNLRVLPKDVKKEALVQTMRGYSVALGVRCTHCHVGEEGKPLSTFDFAADTKTTKGVARAMMKMVADLNGKYLAAIDTGRREKSAISCGTCHHGLSRPEDLTSTLASLTRDQGLDAALHKYQELRDRYYGGYEYDFGPRPLSTLAEQLTQAGKPEEAIQVQEYNVSLHPRDANVHWMLGNLYADAGRRDRAIESIKKSLEIDPGNAPARKRLEQLQTQKSTP